MASPDSGFFPSVSGDRDYTFDFLAAYIGSFISDGVYNGEMAVTADGSAMSVTVGKGRAWLGYDNKRYFKNMFADMELSIANADGVLNRIDTIALRWDINDRSIIPTVLQGTPSSSAIAPAITRTVEQYDLKLAEISVPAGTTAITQSLITDCRLNTDVCGIVTGVVDQVDTSTFYNQIAADLAEFKSTNEADFTAWVDGLKDILDETTAGNLQNEIEALQSDKSDKSTLTAATLPAANWTGDAAPYSQTISVAGVTATSANEVLPGASITADQLEAFQDANIQDGGQAAGSITLLAYGDKPTIDLPARIIVRGDL